MNKPKAFFVVTKFREDIDWIYQYTNQYIIYNKGEHFTNDPRVIDTENIGGNQRDIFKFSYENYTNLPDVVAFLQGNPFEQSPKHVFDKLIYSETLTPLEWYTHNIRSDGGYAEHNSMLWQCKYETVDAFMNTYFKNYTSPKSIEFPPGSQFVVPKENILKYPRKFWKCLMEELPENHMQLAHLIERTLWMIFRDNLQVRKEYYD